MRIGEYLKEITVLQNHTNLQHINPEKLRIVKTSPTFSNRIVPVPLIRLTHDPRENYSCSHCHEIIPTGLTCTRETSRSATKLITQTICVNCAANKLTDLAS